MTQAELSTTEVIDGETFVAVAVAVTFVVVVVIDGVMIDEGEEGSCAGVVAVVDGGTDNEEGNDVVEVMDVVGEVKCVQRRLEIRLSASIANALHL